MPPGRGPAPGLPSPDLAGKLFATVVNIFHHQTVTSPPAGHAGQLAARLAAGGNLFKNFGGPANKHSAAMSPHLAGSGFIIDNRGYIVTTTCDRGQDHITVSVAGLNPYAAAKVVGRIPRPRIALLKVVTHEALAPPLNFGTRQGADRRLGHRHRRSLGIGSTVTAGICLGP